MYYFVISLVSIYLLPFAMRHLAGSFSFPENKILVPLLLFFIVYDLLFVSGISIKGDNADYTIMGVQYAFLAILLSLLYGSDRWSIIILWFAMILVKTLVFVYWLALLISQMLFTRYTAHEIIEFEIDGKMYETRTYLYKVMGSYNQNYRIETYRQWKYLPFEKKVNEDLFELFLMGDDYIQTEKIWMIQQEDRSVRYSYEFHTNIETGIYQKDSDFFN